MTDAPVGETLEQRKQRIAALRRLNSVLPKGKRHPIPLLDDPDSPRRVKISGDDPVKDLLAMSRRGYYQYVYENLGADKDALWDLLLEPRLIHITYQALARKRTLVARLERSPETDVGRRRRNFLEMIENRMRQTQNALPASVLGFGEETARRLFEAVQAHRKALAENGIEPEAWDLALWRAVDDLTPEAEADS